MASKWSSSIIVVINVLIFSIVIYKVSYPDKIKAQEKLVSIIIPCFNCRMDWLSVTLKSIYNQTIFTNTNVIIIDDGSKIPIAHQMHDNHMEIQSNVVIYRHLWNRGLAAARNTGVALSRSKFIIFLDPDDFITFDAIEKLLLAMTFALQEKRIAFVYSAVVHFSDTEKTITSDRFDRGRLNRENYLVSFALVSKKSYLALGGMYEKVQYFEDYDFWLRLVGCLRWRGALVDEPLFWYRRHKDGRSAKIKARNDIDYMQELRQNNPMAFGDILIEADIDSQKVAKFLPAYKSIPDWGLLGLWIWRIAPFLFDSKQLESFNSFDQKAVRSEMQVKVELIQVIFIVPWLQIGGADFYDLDIIKALYNTGKFTITIIIDITGVDNPLWEEFQKYATIFALSRLLDPNFEQVQVDEMLDYFLISRKAHLVYIRNSLNGYLLAKRWWNGKVKFIDIQHLSTPNDRLGWEYSSIPFNSYLTRRFVISNTLAKVVKELLIMTGEKDDHIRIVHPSINDLTDTLGFYSIKKLPLCTNTWKTMIFVGRMTEQKDPYLWVKVAEIIAKADPTWLFLMIGEGYLLDQVKYNLASSKHLRERFLILPFQEKTQLYQYLLSGIYRDEYRVIRNNLDSFCKGQTILVMTSNNEGMPIVIMEAAALNVPIIALNVGALSELQNILGAGLLDLVGSQSANDLAQAILNREKNHHHRPSPRPFPLILTNRHLQDQICKEIEELLAMPTDSIHNQR